VITQAIARGKVWHQRLVPFRHGFHYPLWMVWCDLAEVDAMLARHPAWGRRWRPVVFRDSDFVDARPDSLNDKVREKAVELGLDWQAGRVVMLGQWRTLGTLFNPLVLYLHFSGDSEQPDSMLAEVQNTPWRERHFYPLNLQKKRTGWLGGEPPQGLSCVALSAYGTGLPLGSSRGLTRFAPNVGRQKGRSGRVCGWAAAGP